MNELHIDFAFKAFCNDLQLDLFTTICFFNFKDHLICSITKLCAYIKENNVVKMKDCQ